MQIKMTEDAFIEENRHRVSVSSICSKSVGTDALFMGRWRIIGFSLLVATCIFGVILGYLAMTSELTIRGAAKKSLRFAAFRAIEFMVSIYDPYVQQKALMGPEDWQEWPNDSLTPLAVAEALQALADSSVNSFRLGVASVNLVSDEAAAFGYQTSDADELRQLVNQYYFRSSASGKISQLEEVAALNDWVRRQWVHGTTGLVDFERFYAGDIIEAARKGHRYWCQVASMVFIQVAVSAGYQARLLSLYDTTESPPTHAVAEVWVDELSKWVVFDTDFNVYYVNKAGTPLNGLELHKAYANNHMGSIRVVKGEYRPEVYDVEQADSQPLLLPLYKKFYVEMRNDWLTNKYFPGHPKRSDKTALRWQEDEGYTFLDLMPATSDEAKLYWPLNKVEVRFGGSKEDLRRHEVKAYLKTITPNFDRFEITLNDSLAFSLQRSAFIWQLRPGRNTLSVSSVNKFGHKGIPSIVEIVWEESKAKQSTGRPEYRRGFRS